MTADEEDRSDRDVVVIVPVLRRFHRIAPLLDSLAAATPEPHRIVFVASVRDRQMIGAVTSAAADRPTQAIQLELVPNWPRGDYARKINHAARVTDEPFLFTAADDLAFRPGWLPAALAPFRDPRIAVVGTQDLGSPRVIAGEHGTHLMVRRRYVDCPGAVVDAPGLVMCEEYPHEFVDDELVETAKARGAWAFAGDSIVEHLHPSWGKAPRDALYNQQSQRMAIGRRVYDKRRHLWSP